MQRTNPSPTELIGKDISISLLTVKKGPLEQNYQNSEQSSKQARISCQQKPRQFTAKTTTEDSEVA